MDGFFFQPWHMGKQHSALQKVILNFTQKDLKITGKPTVSCLITIKKKQKKSDMMHDTCRIYLGFDYFTQVRYIFSENWNKQMQSKYAKLSNSAIEHFV